MEHKDNSACIFGMFSGTWCHAMSHFRKSRITPILISSVLPKTMNLTLRSICLGSQVSGLGMTSACGSRLGKPIRSPPLYTISQTFPKTIASYRLLESGVIVLYHESDPKIRLSVWLFWLWTRKFRFPSAKRTPGQSVLISFLTQQIEYVSVSIVTGQKIFSRIFEKER